MKEKQKKPFYKKWWVWLIAVVVLIALVTPGEDDSETAETENEESSEENNNDTEEPEEQEEQKETEEHENDISTEVDLTLETKLVEDVLVVQGETNLPDGTLIAYEVTHEEDFDSFSDGQFEVRDGAYKGDISVTDWPDGEIRVWAAFQTVLGTSVHQPEEVIEVFGEMGENLKGDNVSESDVMNRVELEETLIKNTIDEDENENENEETVSQQNAVSMAEDYLDYTSFSESGLIEQLEFEGFSNEDAVYAVSQLNVDWQEQAVIMAQEYLDYSSFSRSGLIEQLEFEGFSNEHATHAANEVGL